MKENKIENLLGIIFTITGSVLIIVGFILFGTIFNYTDKVDTKGIITKISSYNNKTQVYVSYDIDGKNYEAKLNGYFSDFYKGKEVNIYYDKNDPNQIGMKSLDAIFLIFPGIGFIFFMIGITIIIIKKGKMKLERNLRLNGQKIYANYIETVVNNYYTVNYHHPYNIICEWLDPVENKRYIFKSKNIWINPKKVIDEKNIDQFPVYINPKKKKEYVIDIDSLIKNVEDLR